MDDRSTLPKPVLAKYDLGQIQAVEPKSGGWIDSSFKDDPKRLRTFWD